MRRERKYFGTDGIRGKVGIAPITPDFVMKLGWAAGRVLAKGEGGKILIGKDTRISGYMFESALEAGLSAAGVDIRLLGPMPTPAIAYLTCTFHAQGGIVISASHNPYQDNGIKFFSSDGTKLPDDVELQIEAELERPLKTVDSGRLGRAERMDDASGRYIEFCKRTIGRDISLNGMKVVVDCAHGATYHIAPHVFEELGAQVICLGVEPNGLNINDARGTTKPEALQAKVRESGADLGIALDGDGDRAILVDRAGNIVDGDEIMYIIAQTRCKNDLLAGAVVGTQMSNLGLEIAVRNLGLDFKRAKVGDRYIMEMLLEGGWTLGGETSGHIICLDLTNTGDGIVSALQVLEAMVRSGKSLDALKSGMSKYPQQLINVTMDQPVDLGRLTSVQNAVRDVETELGGDGRVLLRPSGTEPVVRVMVEGKDAVQVNALANQLASAVKDALAGVQHV